MTTISERQHARFYILYKKQKNMRNVYIYAKSQTLSKKQDNFRYIFIHKILYTLLYAIFHEIFEIGIYIYKTHDTLRYVTFLYTKSQTLRKKQDNLRYVFILILFICFRIIFLYAKENPTLEEHSNKSTIYVPAPIYPPKIQVTLSEEKIPSPQHLSKLVNKKTILNLNIASYFLNILASPDELTWSTTGGPINKTIKHLGLTRHRLHKVERTWHMVNKCKEMEQEYTGNNDTRNLNPP